MEKRNAVLFIDNGGYNLKTFYLDGHPSSTPQFFVMPNCVGASTHAGRGITGDHIHRLPHYHGFMVRRPVEKGFIVDGVLQTYLWEQVLQHFGIEDEADVDLWLTVPFAVPKAGVNLLHILLSKRFSFHSVTFVSSSFLALVAFSFYGESPSETTAESAGAGSGGGRKRERSKSMEGTRSRVEGTALMVDVGFSSTTIVPYVDYAPVYSSMVRIDVGGKLLTNRLKQHISYTQINVLEDGWLMDHVKETCCEVAVAPTALLTSYKQPGFEDEVRYFLPTMSALMPLGCRGEELAERLGPTGASLIKGSEGGTSLQSIRLRQERYFIPELLFCPADVGLDQMGLSQALSVGVFRRGLLQHLLPLRPLLLSRVCLYGGTCNLKHFRTRLEKDLWPEGPVEAQGGKSKFTPTVVEPPRAIASLGASEALSGLHASELMPLFGAVALLNHPEGATQRMAVEGRSKVELKAVKAIWIASSMR